MASEPKTKPTGASVEDFLNAVEAPGRREDGFAMRALLGEITGKPAEMWGPSIVGFDRYPMKYANGTTQEWPMIGFSPRKAEMVLYFTGAVKGRADLLAKLGKHRVGGGCLYVKRLSDLDPAVLRELAAWSYSEQLRANPGC